MSLAFAEAGQGQGLGAGGGSGVVEIVAAGDLILDGAGLVDVVGARDQELDEQEADQERDHWITGSGSYQRKLPAVSTYLRVDLMRPATCGVTETEIFIRIPARKEQEPSVTEPPSTALA